MGEDLDYQTEEFLPHKEFLKKKRKEAYLAQKKEAADLRRSEKDQKASDKKAAQEERDQALWEAMKAGRDL